ncbi:MAG: DUF58 domain-containing protein [Planctomycetaceae bacterium]|nr:DUF58 domain-containing protein [Planctomycetaceae bacterium]
MQHDEIIMNLMQGFHWGSNYTFAEPPVSPTGNVGNTLARATGSSLEFMEHREYRPGDDLRRIDWNAYARNDRLALKLYRDEVNPHVDLLLDVSRSMALPGTKKAEAAAALAGFFASAAAEARFTFHLWVTDDGCRKLGRSNGVPLDWDPFDFKSVQTPAEAILRQPPAWRPRGIRIFVSDLLFLADPEPMVAAITSDAAVAAVVQLLAQSDAKPPDEGNLRLIDSETNQRFELFLDSPARKRYLDNLARHQENYNAACRRHGAIMTTIIAEDFLMSQKLDDLMSAELLRFQ